MYRSPTSRRSDRAPGSSRARLPRPVPATSSPLRPSGKSNVLMMIGRPPIDCQAALRRAVSASAKRSTGPARRGTPAARVSGPDSDRSGSARARRGRSRERSDRASWPHAAGAGRPRLSGRDPAPVGLEHLAGEVVGLFGRQKDRAVGGVLDLPEVAHDGALGRGVGGNAAGADRGAHELGGEVDDAAVARGDHRTQRTLRAEERAGHVDGEHRVVARYRDVEELAARVITPALLTRMSSRPKRASTRSTIASTWSARATSACTASARRPSRSISATTSFAPAALVLLFT